MKLWLHEKDTPESTVRHFLPNAAQEQLRHHPTIDLSDDADKADVGVRIYPFTQWGPNNQFFGVLQALSLCTELDILCYEPLFSPHHTERNSTPIEFGQIYTLRGDAVFLRRGKDSLKLDGILTISKRGILCWPKQVYWKNHRILNFSKPASFVGAVHAINTTNRDRKDVEQLFIQKMQDIIHNATRDKKSVTVAYVYCDAMERPTPAHVDLAESFARVSQSLSPASKYTHLASQIMIELGLQTNEYSAIHLRLKDKCTGTFEECCCQSHAGTRKTFTEKLLEKYILQVQNVTGKNRTFISGSPALATFVSEWTWLPKLGVSIWFAKPSHVLEDYEESVVHQLICSKAHTFYKTVDSTWSDVVQLWQVASRSSTFYLNSVEISS